MLEAVEIISVDNPDIIEVGLYQKKNIQKIYKQYCADRKLAEDT